MAKHRDGGTVEMRAETRWRSLLSERLHPVRLLDALAAAGLILAAAWGGRMLPVAAPGAASVAAVLGGLVAFNTLLFFAPCALALHPRRFAPILLVNVAPIPLMTLLYAFNPWLADLALLALAPGVVIARSRGLIAGALSTITAINALAALLFAGVPGMARLGAECGLIGTAAGFAADGIAVMLLRAAGLGIERRLLIGELARFLADLSIAWRSDAAWPAARLSLHAAHVQQLVAEQAIAAGAARALTSWPDDVLPPAELIGAISRSAAELHALPDVPVEVDARMRTSLAALASAAARGTLAEEAPAAEELTRLACAPDLTSDSAVATRLLGMGLLLGDLQRASAPRIKPLAASPSPSVPLMPDSTTLRLALQSAVCMALAIIIMRLLPFPKPYWLPLTTFILVASSFGESARKSIERIMGTGAGLMVGQLIWMAAGRHADLLIGAVAVALFGLFCARNAAYRVLLFWLTVLLSLVLHMADAPLTFYAARLLDTLLGTVIVMLVTGLLLPVRTDDAVRERLAGLLARAAARLDDAAAALRAGGPHDRAGALAGVVGSAQTLRDLAAAETLEDGLLRRPRSQPARRQEAVDRLIRVLIYVDQLLPVLSGFRVSAGTLAILADMATAARDASQRIRSATSLVGLGRLHASGSAQKSALATAFAAGQIGATQLEAERRLLGATDGLVAVLDALEATMAPAPRSSQAELPPAYERS